MSEFLAFTVAGIVTGSIYAIGATGLVVTYSTSGIFNIAHGAIGMIMAFLYWELRVHQGWPTLPALVMVVGVLAPLFGAFLERVLMRPLRGSSIATNLVVTVGLMVGLIGLGQTLWSPTVARNLPRFFGRSGFRFGSFVSYHQVVIMITAISVAVGLWLFLSRTRLGIAMRAVVDDRNLLSLTGAQPDRVSMASWAIGASLASIAGILIAPNLQMNHLLLTFLVINTYAAAMVGRLKSLPLTFMGAIALGLIEAYAVGYVKLEGWLLGLRPALPTLFLFVVLLAMPEARLRAGRVVGAVTPRVPSRGRTAAGSALMLAVSMVLALVLGRGDLVRLGQGLALGLIMLSLVPLTGYGGQVSLCQMTFAGLGAFAMAKMGHGGNPLGLLVAALLAAGVGALAALPALRLQGLYLALATMAFAVLMDNMVFPNNHVFGNLGSVSVDRLHLPFISFASDRAYFVLLAIAFIAFGALVIAIRRGEFGRLLAAMRDSPVACATLGLSLTRTKLAVFMLSAAMAGVGGALFAGINGSAGASQFVMLQSLPILLLAVIGGITSVSGALIGGIAYALLPILEQKIPSMAGIVFLLTGLGAVMAGRNPNGMAHQISQRLRTITSAGRSARPTLADPDPAPEVSVAAPTG